MRPSLLLARRVLWGCGLVTIAGTAFTFGGTEPNLANTMAARQSQPANTVDLRSLAPSTELAKRLRRHVEFLASPELSGRKPGTPGNRAAAKYLTEQFGALGLEPLPSLNGYAQRITPELGDNLIGVRRATHQPSHGGRYILIGAHYDHLGGRYLGADDNASAVAILLETARLLPPLSHHPVIFAAFNAEEAPYIRSNLMGSQHFVDHLPKEVAQPSDFHAVVIMDLMGGAHWTPLRNVIFAAGAEASPGLYQRLKQSLPREALGVRREARDKTEASGFESSPLTPDASRAAADAAAHGRLTNSAASPDVTLLTRRVGDLTVLPLGMHLVEEIPLAGRVSFSDYDAFRNASVPFLFLSSGRTPRYHQPTDLPGTLHYERMAETVSWLQVLLQLVDQDQRPYSFEASRMEFADDVAALQPLVSFAAEWNSRIPGTSPVSLLKLRMDDRWLKKLDVRAPTQSDVKRLEKLSIRLQCLLADFYGCLFL